MTDDLWPPEEVLDPAIPDEVFLALADPYRRFAVYYLGDQGPTSVEDLATLLSGWLVADETDVATQTDRENVLGSLRAVHIPNLEAANLVDYDRGDDVVSPRSSPTPNVDTLVAWSQTFEGTDTGTTSGLDNNSHT
jgi:hypothetical protein